MKESTNSTTRSLLSMGVFLAVVLLLVSGAAGGETMALDSQQEFDLDAQAAQAAGACETEVHLAGRGEVSAAAFGQDLELEQDFSQQLPCDSQLTLTARPSGRWQFDHWEGVPEQDRYRQTISILAPADVTAVFVPRDSYTETLETPYYRAGELVTTFEGLEPIQRPQGAFQRDSADNVAPQLDIWYGSVQNFGEEGTAQEWINVLGRVSDGDGIEDLDSLSYTLNSDPTVHTLHWGGIGSQVEHNDGRRLWNEGDFNVEIDKDDLQNGANTVEITAEDTLGASTSTTVTVNYDPNSYWPITYDIDWSTATSILDNVQITDGKWSRSADGLRIVETGYDRVAAIGQGSFAGGGWEEFEIEVEVTIHSYDPAGFDQLAPAVGLVARWQGHTDYNTAGCQPKCGYLPIGAAAWYSWRESDGRNRVSMWSNDDGKKIVAGAPAMEFGETYWWKMRVENVNEPTGTYYWKYWKKGTQEPAGWLTSFDESQFGGTIPMLESGSILLLSHHVDVTFGDVHVRPLNQGPDNTPPEISNVEVIPEPNGATFSWETDEPATGKVDAGATTAYGKSAVANQLTTQHSVYVSGLAAAQLHHFQITATDLADNSATTPDDTFTTQQLVGLVSDDFNACELGGNWQFMDPLNEADFKMNSQQLEIIVPQGYDYNIWPEDGQPTNRSARIMRSATDPDEMKVKFDGGFEGKTAMQGILVEQDGSKFLRASFHYKDGSVDLVVIGYDGTKTKTLASVEVSNSDLPGPMFIWLQRENGRWIVSYSTNGSSWPELGAVDWPLSVTKVGVFAGNFSQGSAVQPAFVSKVDYVFDAQNPIAPEDAKALILPVTIEGQGTVIKDKECGNPVTLTAAPADGWGFERWEGGPLDGQTNPVVTTPFAVGDTVKAVFGQGNSYSLSILVDGQGSVMVSPNKQEFNAGEQVTLTAVPTWPKWYFTSWSIGAQGNENPMTIVIAGDTQIGASFRKHEMGDFTSYLPTAVDQ